MIRLLRLVLRRLIRTVTRLVMIIVRIVILRSLRLLILLLRSLIIQILSLIRIVTLTIVVLLLSIPSHHLTLVHPHHTSALPILLILIEEEWIDVGNGLRTCSQWRLLLLLELGTVMELWTVIRSLTLKLRLIRRLRIL